MTENIQISLRALPHHEGLALPAYMSDGAAGMDLVAAIGDSVTLNPGERALLPTGLSISIPPGYEAQVRPRSGLANKHGIGVLNSPGTIDSDYRGEIQIILINLGSEPYTIRRGERIAQIIFSSYAKANFKIVSELDVTIRNERGFGHTGI